MRLLCFIFLLLLASNKALLKPSTLEEAFNSFQIVPSYLPVVPQTLLSVRCGDTVIDLGNDINPYLCFYPPNIHYDANPRDLYTLIMFEVDKPTSVAPYTSPYVHLMVANIPGNNITAGNFIVPSIPPMPVPGSGFHRYIFVVYKQSTRINVNTTYFMSLSGWPANFSPITFPKEYNLGNPYAGNFFIARTTVCNDQPKQIQRCNA